MYAYLKGSLVSSKPDHTVLDIGGIGYYILTPLTLHAKCIKRGSELLLYTAFITREDSMRLFGFETEVDKSLFEKLIAISGLGPKTALSMISQSDSINLPDVIAHRNIAALTKIPGIGKKTAERIVIELSDKIKPLVEPNSLSLNSLDAISALMNLGYKEKEATKNVQLALKDSPKNTTLSELISLSLSKKSLARN